MKQTIKLLGSPFQSSSGLTPQFDAFYKTFKKEFTKYLTGKGCYDVEMNRGHFYVSGFFTTADNKIYYFSFGDVRWPMGNIYRMLYRTAEDYADYTGGTNQYVNINQLDNWSIFR